MADEEIQPILPVVAPNTYAPNVRMNVEIIIDQVKNKEVNYTFSPIYMAPSRFRELSPSSFTPRVVSIGPMHKGNTTFKSMEAQKPTYLKDLLTPKEGSLDEEILNKCMKVVTDNIEKIKRCYFGMKNMYADDELARMMVMDGCFILQFISKLSKSVDTQSENRLRSGSIALDLVLLENQIPFFVLEYIYEQCTFDNLEPKPSLITMLCILLEHVNPFLEKLDERNLADTNYNHILGLLHKFYQPKYPTPKILAIPAAHSVVNLHKVGVKFRPKKTASVQNLDEVGVERTPNEKTETQSVVNEDKVGEELTAKEKITTQSVIKPDKDGVKEKTNWPMAIEFESSRKPTLIMPGVIIDNFFEVVIRNLIVYEQFSPVNNHVTSYAMAMDMLADSPDDIAKLGQSGIIINHIGSNEKASNMINNICKDVTFVDFYYIEPWKDMDIYYKSYWSRHFGVLKRTHFSSPWKAIALIVGIILFSIQIVQFAFYLKDK